MLILGRFLQGLGAAGGSALARTILRDMMTGATLARYYSYYSMCNFSLIAMAPMFGGYLQHFFGWRASFILLSFYTCFAIVIAIFLLPETNIYQSMDHLKPKILINNLKTLFTSHLFLITAFIAFFGYAGRTHFIS